MTSRTYTGPVPGRVTVAGRLIPFKPGVPVEVSAEEAALLDLEPGWGAVIEGDGSGSELPPFDPDDPGPHWSDPALDGLDKDALIAFADEHDIEINRRFGEPKLRQQIADALHANDNPEGSEPEHQEPTP